MLALQRTTSRAYNRGMTSDLLPTPALVQRLVDAERDCMVDWLRALEAEPDNPLGIAIRTFGRATALVCSTIPAQIFNRVFGMTAQDRHLVPAILAFYAEHRAAPLFDLNPYAIPPFWVEPNLLPVLAQHGLYQGAFHQILYGVPSTDVPAAPGHIAIQEVGPDARETFGQVYQQVWGNPAAIQVLLGDSRFRCYLASISGEPAGL